MSQQLFTTKKQTFCGYTMQQTWNALWMLEQVLRDNQDIMRLVELGTGRGGLTLFFGLHLHDRNGCVFTIDNKPITAPAHDRRPTFLPPKRHYAGWCDWSKRLNICFELRDVFAEATIQRVQSFIKGYRCLVFCDGGNKPREVALYSRLLKRNDLIMAHDYGVKGSCGVEISFGDLDQKTLSLLTPYRQREFDALKTRILSMRRR